MKPADHLEKARRIETTISTKLNRDSDYELWLDGYMLAGTHLLNLILHKFAVTGENFDLSHSHKLEAPIDEALRPLFEAMSYIEHLRPDYLRGNKAWRFEDGLRCLEYYQKLKAFAERALG